MNSTGVARRLLQRRARRGAHLERRPQPGPDRGRHRPGADHGTGLIARYGLNEGTGATVTTPSSSVAGAHQRHAHQRPAVGEPAPRSPGKQPARRSSAPTSTDRTDAEGAVISLDADATDPDAGDTLIYSATGLPGGITINPTTGVISGTLSSTSAGSYSTVITVSDGTLTDTDSFTWTVTNTNQPPVFSTDITDQHRRRGRHVISLDADATDADRDTLTYSATGLPAGITIDAEHGRHQRHADDRQRGYLQRHRHRQRRHLTATPTPSPGR